MKTVFINGSPKKHFSASNYFLKLQSLFVKGQHVFLKLRSRNDDSKIFDQIRNADIVVFSIPLYVDSVPSHILAFLKEMEHFCEEHKLTLKIYVIANNGFIEGKQNAPLFRVMENFCGRCHFQWGGGIGIGGGVMFNALKIVLLIEVCTFFLSNIFSGLLYKNWFPASIMNSFLSIVLVIAFLHSGVFFYMVRMGIQINRMKKFGEKYTRILLPSFLFVFIANIYFIIASLLHGGLFRGWLKKKHMVSEENS